MWYVIIDCYSFLECIESNHVQDWHEKLLLKNLSTRVNLNNRWIDIVPFRTLNHGATVEDSAALALSLFDTKLESLNLSLRLEGADEGVRVQRISNRNRTVSPYHLGSHFVENGILDEHSPLSCAPLTACASRSKHTSHQRHVLVGVGHHHTGIITSELKNSFAEAPGDSGRCMATSLRGSRKRHQVQSLVLQEAFTDFSACALAEREDRIKAIISKHVCDDLADSNAHE